MATDPDPGRSALVARTTQARAQSRALRKLAADTAEAVARVEDEVAWVHERITGQGGPLAEQARQHAGRAREVAAREHGEAERRRAGPDCGQRRPGPVRSRRGQKDGRADPREPALVTLGWSLRKACSRWVAWRTWVACS